MNESLQYTLFQFDNDFEIPSLREDRQPIVVAAPFLCYGEQSRQTDLYGNGSIHFYTDDYRFTKVFEKPSSIVKMNPRNIVEPNFSCYVETPIAIGTAQIYKKRAVARYCQDHGINVFVDLNVNHKFYKVNMLGVPKGYHSFCTRGYEDRMDYLDFEYNLAKEWSDGNDLLFAIYGGGQKVRKYAQDHRCIYIAQMVQGKSKISNAKKIQEDIAFGLPLGGVDINQIVKEVTDNQVINYKAISNGK